MSSLFESLKDYTKERLTPKTIFKACLALFFICLTIISGTTVTEFVSYGIQKLDFHNYFLMSYISNSSLILLFPFVAFQVLMRKRSERNGENGLIGETHAKRKPLTWMELYTRSIFLVVLNLGESLCSYYSLDMAPPSITMVVSENAASVVFLLSIFFLWNDVKHNLPLKFVFVGFSLVGVFFIGFGKDLTCGGMSGGNLSSKYPHLFLGIVIAFGNVICCSLWDIVFVKLFVDLDLRQIFLLNFFCGLNCFVIFSIFVPVLHIMGLQTISFPSLANALLCSAFLVITCCLSMLYLLSCSFVLRVFPYPTLFNVICMMAEVAIVVIFDQVFLGVEYGFVVYIGLACIFVSCLFLNILEVAPSNLFSGPIKFCVKGFWGRVMKTREQVQDLVSFIRVALHSWREYLQQNKKRRERVQNAKKRINIMIL